MVVGSAIIMAGVWWYSNKVYPMPWFVTLKGNLWKKDYNKIVKAFEDNIVKSCEEEGDKE